MAPISSLRSAPATSSDLSPWASRFMVAVMVSSGRVMPRRTTSAASPRPSSSAPSEPTRVFRDESADCRIAAAEARLSSSARSLISARNSFRTRSTRGVNSERISVRAVASSLRRAALMIGRLAWSRSA